MTLFVLLLRGKNVVNVVNDDIFSFLKKRNNFFLFFNKKFMLYEEGVVKKKKKITALHIIFLLGRLMV